MKLLKDVLEQDPGRVVSITTGYSTVENAAAALKHGAFDFLPKPFTCDELLSCVARAIRAIELRLVLGLGLEWSWCGRSGSDDLLRGCERFRRIVRLEFGLLITCGTRLQRTVSRIGSLF